MPQKYVCRNCECNSAGISQSGLSCAGDPETEQTEMEGVKGGENPDIYRYVCEESVNTETCG